MNVSENGSSKSAGESLATSESPGCIVGCKGTHSYCIKALYVVY